MNNILSPYVLIMIAAVMVCAGIIVYAWPYRRHNSETIPLILLLFEISEWIVAALLGLLDQISRIKCYGQRLNILALSAYL